MADTPVRSDRIHFVDAMRGILMLLGVVLHSAQVFNPAESWRVESAQTSLAAQWLVTVIHTFRMPAFFVVAGYLFMVSFRSRGAAELLRDRVVRLVVPLLVVGFSLNVMQEWLLSVGGGEAFDPIAFVVEGRWVSHLWFLVNLFIYTLLVVGVMEIVSPVLGASGAAIWRRCASLLERVPPFALLLVLSTWPIIVPLLSRMGVPVYENYLGFLRMFSLFEYLVYFILGVVMAGAPGMFRRFCEQNILVTSVLLLTGVAGLYLLPASDSPDIAGKVAFAYLNGLVIWASVGLCFVFFRRCIDKRSFWLEEAARSSYSVYLFHHFLVVAVGLLVVVEYDIPPLPGMVLLISVAAGVSLFLHYGVVKRFPLLMLLLNGVRPQERARPVEPLAVPVGADKPTAG